LRTFDDTVTVSLPPSPGVGSLTEAVQDVGGLVVVGGAVVGGAVVVGGTARVVVVVCGCDVVATFVVGAEEAVDAPAEPWEANDCADDVGGLEEDGPELPVIAKVVPATRRTPSAPNTNQPRRVTLVRRRCGAIPPPRLEPPSERTREAEVTPLACPAAGQIT